MAGPSRGQVDEVGLARVLRRAALLALCVLCVMVFLLWRLDNPRIERARMAVADAFAPSLEVVGPAVTAIRTALQDWDGLRDAHARNADLRREIEQLRGWRDVARSLERENAQLRALNNVRLTPRMGFAAGDVVADAGGPFARSVMVNIGADDGVRDGAAALDGAGLVGRVVGVGDAVSRVLLLTDFNSRVPVKIAPSGKRALLVGGDGPAPDLRFIADADAVVAGMRVLTSGDGGVLPPNLPVGVVALDRDGDRRVRLAADYDGLRFVRILLWSGPPPAEAPGDLILPQADAGAGLAR